MKWSITRQLLSSAPSANTSSICVENGWAYVGYTAAAYSVTIDITPGTSNSNPLDFLIGQKVAATLNIHGFPSDPSDTYSWTISGGSPFDGYSPGVYFPLFTVQTNDMPHAFAYLAKPDTGVFTCSAVLEGLSVTATKSVNIAAPTFGVDVDTGSPALAPDNNSVQLTLPPYTYADTIGIKWTCSVTTPDEFIITSQTDGESDCGNWEWVQLLSDARQFTDTSSNIWVESYSLPPAPAVPLSQSTFLDTSYPYPFWKDIITGAYSDGTTGATASADGTSYWSSDAPREGFCSDAVSFDIYDAYQDTMMYCPPGNSCYVPLRETDWFWGCLAQKSPTTGVWGLSSPSADYSDMGNYPSFP